MNSHANPLLSTLAPILPSWAKNEGLGLAPLNTGGSIRQYYRISREDDSAIVMDSSRLPKDFDSYLALSAKLQKTGIPVPEIYATIPEKSIALLEDAGNTTLYSLVKSKQKSEALISHYKEVLENLVHMQCSEELADLKKEFDFEGIRWETDYFYKQFILRYCEITPRDEKKLFQEFDQLAQKLEGVHRVFMHRDFQSQNIIVTPKGVVFLDFQGGRLGLPQYDLVSLIRDPYVAMPEEMEHQLTEFYLKSVQQASWFNEKEFIENMILAAIQRHSQALGAFAYLSMELGKNKFIAHIPPCLDYLNKELSVTPEFPYFRELAEEARTITKNRAS